MKKFLSILLAMFVGMSVIGCYRNTSIATECGKSYTIYVDKTNMSSQIHKFLLEEGYTTFDSYYYKRGEISDSAWVGKRRTTFVITVRGWVESGKKLKYDIHTGFGDYDCQLNGFNENFKYFDDLIERMALKLQEKI